MIFAHLFIFLFGLAIGSFLNCVIFRLEKSESLAGRSYCPNCKNQLRWLDLIPVLSFIFLGGRCRYCHQKISSQYPLVEISTALLFLLILNFTFLHNVSIAEFLNLAFLFYIASSLIVIFVYDLKHFLIPDKVLFPAIVITALYQFIFHFHFFVTNALWAGIVAATFFAAMFFFSKGTWMGFGDAKLALFMGFLLGFSNILVALFLAFFVGAVVGVTSILMQKKGMKSEMPFAPFLILGTGVAFFSGGQIVDLYFYVFQII